MGFTIKIGDQELSVYAWSKRYNINSTTVYNRINQGWDPIEAITTPVKKGKHQGCSNYKRTPTYISWAKMKERCTLKSHVAYPSYGGAGIKVCQNWLDSYNSFLGDMGERPKGTSLDRIDSTKGYYKENCRWATSKQQQNNLKSNIKITIDGQTKGMKEWASIYGINQQTISERIKRGWSPIKAVITKAVVGRNQWGG